MPIFQADLEQLERESRAANANDYRFTAPGLIPPSASPQQQLLPPTLARRLSEESIRTDLCEGPVLDSPQPAPQDADLEEAITSDRADLIERLKRGESPTWIPNRHFESLYTERPSTTSPPRSSRPSSRSSNLLPPANITPEKPKNEESQEEDDRIRDGLSIQRPRSALHSGDFTQDQERRAGFDDHGSDEVHPARSQHASNPWMAASPPLDFSPFHFDSPSSFTPQRIHDRSTPSSLSSSLSSSFVYRPPTSPLVQSESNEDLDLLMPVRDLNTLHFNTNHRRHASYSSPSSSVASSRPSPLGRHASLRRETTFPYQAHQPRRSLALISNASPFGTSPQTPAFLRHRRPSLGTETSPMQHASMVGSYEESILRGRMSTTPSKPLDFLAQIGVLGLGKCKSSLKCPPHVTLPFPAVFYSYGNSSSHGRTLIEDGPSPYVGQIDLENGLPNPSEEHRSRRKLNARTAERRMADDGPGEAGPDLLDRETRRATRPRRGSGSPRAPPGGSYRIPEKGQIQIVIKNPNKTAVKLFLVPYDLAGMEPGTKTFIRQRSYSAGPIIENVQVPQGTTADRAILRYLVHLHICCPSKGRYYLYKSIRIVFANRVPDGKEKLRIETTWPEPRFTVYKPIRLMHPPSTGGPGAILAAEKAFRRRSSGFSIGRPAHGLDALDGISHTLQSAIAQHSSPSPLAITGNNQPIDPIPLRLPQRSRLGSDTSSSTSTTGATGLRSPGSSQASRPTTKDGLDAQISLYEKLNKGDIGYGGNAYAGSGRGSPAPGEGLLSQRLRSLGAQGMVGSPPEREE